MPQGVFLRDFGGHFVMFGREINDVVFEEIKGTLPAEVQSRLIGWRDITRPGARS